MRHGHVPDRGCHWWWLDRNTVIVHTGTCSLILVQAKDMPHVVGPNYAERETT